MDTLKESLGSGWAQIFTSLIGGVKSSTRFWTGMSEAIGGVVSGFFDFAQISLKTWRQMGGFKKTMEGFANILAPFKALFSAIGEAWQAAFPDSGKGAGKTLYGISAGFAAITSPLQLLAKLIRSLTSPLTTFFQILHIGGAAVGELLGFIGKLVSGFFKIGEIKPPSGGFIKWIKDLASGVADAIDKINDLISKGASIGEAFGAVNIKLPKIPSLPSLPSIGSLFGGGGGKEDTGTVATLSSGVKGLTTNVLGLVKAQDETAKGPLFNPNAKLDTSRFQDVGDAVKTMAGNVANSGDEVQSVGAKIGGALKGALNAVKNFLGNLSFDDVVGSFNMAVLATLALSISRFLNTMSKSFQGFMGVGEGISDVLENTGNALKSFQTQARAKLILNIAIAIGILAVALIALSFIPKDKLATAMAALAGLAVILKVATGALADAVGKMDGLVGGAKLAAISIALIAFAGAMILVAIAAKMMNGVDWNSIAKAAAAMFILKKGIETLASIDTGGTVRGAAAMIVMSGALIVFAIAVRKFASIDWIEFLKGATMAALALTVMVVALQFMQVGIGGAAAMVIMTAALWGFAVVVEKFAKMKWSQFFKGLGMISLALLVLVVALNALQTGIGGAAAMVIITAALYGMAGAIAVFAQLDWGTFFKGLGMIAIAMISFTLLMSIMGAFSPLILAASVALLVFGGAMALLGLGVVMLAKGLGALILVAAGAAAAISTLAVGLAVGMGVFFQTLAAEAPIIKDAFLKILQTIIDAIVAAVPMIIDGIKRLWEAVKTELQGDDKKTDAEDSGKSWIQKVVDGINKKMPAIIDNAAKLLTTFINGLSKNAGKISAAGANLVAKVINGIASRLGGIIEAGANLIIAWLKGISKEFPRIARAAADAVIKFINSMADAIRDKGPELGKAMGNLGVAMVEGLIGGIGSMFKSALDKVGELGNSIIGKAKGILKINSPSRVFIAIGSGIVEGLTKGIQDNASAAIVATASLMGRQIAVANEYMSRFIQGLDQQAIAAQAKASGLALAAQRAQKAAKMTKGKKNQADDKAANKIAKQAEKQQKIADAAQARADAEKAKQDRAEQFANASSIDRAKMRSEDAQGQLDAAKAAEARAAKNLEAAAALDKQSKVKGVSAKERKSLQKQADDLRAQARKDAKAADAHLDSARRYAGDALAYQKKAGEEAAAAFQKQFEQEANAAAEAEAFDKLSNEEKAAKRREQAAELQAKAAKDLEDAKKLAFTDLDAANDLAAQALDEAEKARQFLKDAESYANQGNSTPGGGGPLGTVITGDPTEAAAIAFNQYSDMFDSATAAAAAGGNKIEFNQYNTSPEPLDPTTVYRNTNNQLTFAEQQLSDIAA